jgi:hypothetical protein
VRGRREEQNTHLLTGKMDHAKVATRHELDRHILPCRCRILIACPRDSAITTCIENIAWARSVGRHLCTRREEEGGQDEKRSFGEHDLEQRLDQV